MRNFVSTYCMYIKYKEKRVRLIPDISHDYQIIFLPNVIIIYLSTYKYFRKNKKIQLKQLFYIFNSILLQISPHFISSRYNKTFATPAWSKMAHKSAVTIWPLKYFAAVNLSKTQSAINNGASFTNVFAWWFTFFVPFLRQNARNLIICRQIIFIGGRLLRFFIELSLWWPLLN